MKLMVMAGGTGGHIFPAAAVAEQFKSEGWDIRWLGSFRGMEGDIVPKLGFEFCGLPVTAWRGGKLRKLIAPLNLLRALWSSYWIIRKERPDVVIGFGGYASAPGGVAAIMQKIPLVLHEQNGIPGLTNKNLEKKANAVLQAFPNTFIEPYEVVGNPVRYELSTMPGPKERGIGQANKLKVLVLGGSQGAAAINDLMPDALALSKSREKIEVWHQAGKGKAELTSKKYLEAQQEATVVEFIDNMTDAYAWADLVVARSGASTVSELAAVGVYSILVPYPWHEDKQQYRNAKWLTDGDAASCKEQLELKAQSLANEFDYWNKNRPELLQKAENAWGLGVRDSAKRISKVVNELLSKQHD
jgi:UDP-N-acetylglucosamine--N-acetylmuramyl-(pentapeptide) pyrophosphoryl-undecaprenol N-acetylglucosamine transferase